MGLTRALVLLLPVLGTPAAAQQEPDAVLRGKYLFHAGACDSCHTDHPNRGAFLAGGRRMHTEFGTFYVPNITPDPETGIGDWSAEDFRRAMIEGRTPGGSHYYPVFPYRWYTGMSERDVADMWAYLRSIPPVRNPVRPHELPFPFNLRFLLLGWKLINFDPGTTVHDPERSEDWNRGAYLVNHIGRWTIEDVVRALKRSIRPDGVPIRGPMAEYVDSGSSHLSEQDLEAAATYLFSVEAQQGPVRASEERVDRRLLTDGEPQSAGAIESGGGGMGSAGMGLLRAAGGGRMRAK